MTARPLQLTFWGVRGSVPTPVAGNLGVGGNTACIAIRCGGQPSLIFDAGSGIRGLGNSLVPGEQTHVFLTHFHWDHIQGLPFFAGLQHSTLYSSAAPDELARILGAQMLPPYYPVPMPSIQYQQVDARGERIGDVLVRPFPLHHPNGATGYRIESHDASIVYASDHEHGDAATDAIVREYARGADILIYDAQYTPEEYEDRRGWGHSTWREAVKLAQEAGVHQLILFHYDPSRTDRQVDAVVRAAQQEFPNTIAAREGWSTSL